MNVIIQDIKVNDFTQKSNERRTLTTIMIESQIDVFTKTDFSV